MGEHQKKLVMYEDDVLMWEVVDKYPKEPTGLVRQYISKCMSDEAVEFVEAVEYMHGLLRRAESVSADEE